MARHEVFLRQWARMVGARAGLSWDDLNDAEQEALLAVLCALPAYDGAPSPQITEPQNHGPCASFRTYAATVAKNRVLNFARGLHRYEGHIAASLDAFAEEELLESFLAEHCQVSASLNGPNFSADPLDAIANAHLHAALLRLKPPERRFLSVWLKGETDADAAQQLGISPQAAKLRRQRIVRKLRRFILESGSCAASPRNNEPWREGYGV